MRKHVPNALTVLNLSAGLVSITMAMQDRLVIASLLIFLAGIFDYLDGTAARLLKAWSDIGKQLDSLADLVSFGVAPGMIIYEILITNCSVSCPTGHPCFIPYFAMLIPICSALRLAKFNIDPTQTINFSGLPTPANAVFFASFPLIIRYHDGLRAFISLDFLIPLLSNSRVIAGMTVIFSYLLISDLRLFSLKFKQSGWKENQHRFVFLIISLLLLLIFSVSAIPLIIITYLILSLLYQKRIQQ